MAPRNYIYQTVRRPSRNKVSEDDNLSIWCANPKNSDSSIDTGDRAHAPKANTIFKYVRSAILDPKQIHLRATLQAMVNGYVNSDKVMESMLASLESEPPVLSLYKFRQDDSSMGFTDVNMKERIFICNKLSAALEKSEDGSPLETRLKFLVFNTLWHEFAHWLHYEPDSRDFSGDNQRWKDFAGEKVNTRVQDPDRSGEAGYFVEGTMWGGIITSALPFRPYGEKNAVPGFYQEQSNSLESTRPWDQIALVLRQPGESNDLYREHIPVEAMTKRLTPGTIIETFAADELVPLYMLKKGGGKTTWTFEDPTPTKDPMPTEGDTRRSKRRKIKVSYKERSLLTVIPDHINILYATAEYESVDRDNQFAIEEDEQN